MRKEGMVAKRVWQRQALHAYLPACVLSACVTGSRRADRTPQEPQEAAVNPPEQGLSHPNLSPGEHLRGPGTQQGAMAQSGTRQVRDGDVMGPGKPLKGWVPDRAEDTPHSFLVPGRAFPSKGQAAAASSKAGAQAPRDRRTAVNGAAPTGLQPPRAGQPGVSCSPHRLLLPSRTPSVPLRSRHRAFLPKGPCKSLADPGLFF